jgi:hypothetical protein
MDNYFEKGSLQSSPALSEALGPHQKHRQRIEKELSEFLSAQEARETATCVYNLAIEIDEEIDKILKDPLVRRPTNTTASSLLHEALGASTSHSMASKC